MLASAAPVLGGSQTPTIASSPTIGRSRRIRIRTPTSVSPYLSTGRAALLGSTKQGRSGWRTAMRTNWRCTGLRSGVRRMPDSADSFWMA